MAKQPRSLAGQVVAITGGARGIGRVTAEALVREGARIALADIDVEQAQKTADELGAGTTAFAADVTNRESFTAFIDAAEEQLGPIDVLINNAGIMVVGPFTEEEDAVTKREIDINLFGVIYGMKIILPRMRQRGNGHIINISSAAGKVGLAGEATYCASKHAVVGLCEAMRMELEETPIEITVVMPNLANTELAAGMKPGRFLKLVEPEEIAQAIVSALKYPRFDVYVPKQLGLIIKISTALPRRARRVMEHFFKTADIATQVDRQQRAAYVARSTQGAVSVDQKEAKKNNAKKEKTAQ